MIINCVAYEQGRKLADIAKTDISEYLRRPGCFVWVAIKDPEPDELLGMQEEFGLHELAVEDAMAGHQRPKVEEYGDSIFTVLKVPQLKGDEMEVGEVDLFVGKNYVLSVRHRTEPGFQAVRDRSESEPELLSVGSGFVFYALMDNVVDRYFPLVDALEVQLEAIEERIFADEKSARANIQDLYALKHKLMVMRHAVEPLIEVVHKLYGGRVPSICVGVQDYFRDIYDHLLRVSQQLDGLRDMVITAMSVNLAMINMGTGEVTKRLAAYAALVAVPTLIAGIYGMNFQHMPELKMEWGYPLALAIMVGIDTFLWTRFRKSGWL
ncbi:MAG: magnesium/cobalt transporter CorA [Usitatibacter sp.]